MSQGPAISSQPYQTGRFVPRGSDAAAYDYVVGNFTTDSVWRDLNLSAIVPAGAIAVLLRMQTYEVNGGKQAAFRKNGNAQNYHIAALATPGSNIIVDGQLIVECDANRVIEYRFSNQAWASINVNVEGWWI